MRCYLPSRILICFVSVFLLRHITWPSSRPNRNLTRDDTTLPLPDITFPSVWPRQMTLWPILTHRLVVASIHRPYWCAFVRLRQAHVALTTSSYVLLAVNRLRNGFPWHAGHDLYGNSIRKKYCFPDLQSRSAFVVHRLTTLVQPVCARAWYGSTGSTPLKDYAP